MITRREWVRSLIVAGAGALSASEGNAQERGIIADTSNLFAMDQSAARSVRLPPKPGASASMSPGERDALEHRMRCQCGCTLDIYTCRTTDFSCQVSPSMHRDVMALVSGGYTAEEILESFVAVYGERVLMSPPKVGFNRVAYLLPGFAMAVGAVVLALVIRHWNRPKLRAARPAVSSTPDASPEELARLEAAVRDDS